ncbi:hypothetical protein JOC85_001760 [Bacillus mesophilus]|uniref:hypothetical protein n=1 Tax=Bacillus mesophilus TaxID=1808955 RepID=UPI0013D4B1B4|nr:hypothetical protein [Bacillus mesophilus]MBM7660988.1 hypothetical protein [Bacillus mesophilus]
MWIGMIISFVAAGLTLWLEGFGGLLVTNTLLGFLTGTFLNFYLHYVDKEIR